MRKTKTSIEPRNCPNCNTQLRIMYTEKDTKQGGVDVLAHCECCHRDWKWYQDATGLAHEMHRHFWG